MTEHSPVSVPPDFVDSDCSRTPLSFFGVAWFVGTTFVGVAWVGGADLVGVTCWGLMISKKTEKDPLYQQLLCMVHWILTKYILSKSE